VRFLSRPIKPEEMLAVAGQMMAQSERKTA
jgi:hypothetical protein